MADPQQIGPAFPDRLRAFREQRRWTQIELAQCLGTTAQTVSRWEQGKPPQPRLRRRLEELMQTSALRSVDSAQVLSFPTATGPGVHPGADDLQVSVIASTAARLSSGAALSDGELALIRSLFAAVGLDWNER